LGFEIQIQKFKGLTYRVIIKNIMKEGGMKKAILFLIVLLFIMVPVATYAVTPVSDPHGPGDELNLYQVVNAMMGTSFTSSAQLGAYEIDQDDWWHEWDGHISIVATYAGYTQNLWWVSNSSSGDIFIIAEDGLHNVTINFQSSGDDFYFKDVTDGGSWFSRESLNSDGMKHMVTYSFGNGVFICGFEDLSGLGDQDYQDLVFKLVYGAAPVTVPAISYIPDQAVSTGYPFTNISLDNYVRDDDAPAGITWTASGGTNISVNIDSNRVAHITYPHLWTGSETITFRATDPAGHFDSEEVTFTANPPEAPVVTDIPDQTIKNGQNFAPIHLDDYVYNNAPGIGDEDITWTTSGGSNISVSIDSNRVAHITYPQGWTGSETITFTATLNPSASNPATFTVLSPASYCIGCRPGSSPVGGYVMPVNKFMLLSP
jgi:hypothetical protein